MKNAALQQELYTFLNKIASEATTLDTLNPEQRAVADILSKLTLEIERLESLPPLTLPNLSDLPGDFSRPEVIPTPGCFLTLLEAHTTGLKEVRDGEFTNPDRAVNVLATSMALSLTEWLRLRMQATPPKPKERERVH